MFTRRVISATILIPLVAWVTYAGGLWFWSLVLLASLIAGFEFFQLMEKGGFKPFPPAGLLLTALLLADAFWPERGFLSPGLSLIIVASLIWQLFQKDTSTPVADWALTVAGGLYIGWLIRHFVALRSLEEGFRWTMLTFLITWAGDTGAYFTGLKWGRHPFWPRLSPRKTWEGTVGGWFSGVVVSLILGSLIGLAPLHSIAIGALLSTLAPFGDLSVSMIKRQVGVKDSSHLIPGHGGMLDRIDSLLFTVVGMYYYVSLVLR